MTTNALHLRWVPVESNGTTSLVSLREALADGHLYDGIGATLAPVEKEGLLRFLTSAAAGVLRDANDLRTTVRELRFDAIDVNRFVDTYAHLFDLRDADKPFLQEWHAPSTAPDDAKSTPLQQLHVHVPGGSSSRWCLRDEPRNASDLAVLTLLLVTTWFHGKPSNSGRPDFYSDKCIAGAPSGGAWDTAFHLIGDTLAETLLANTLNSWVDNPASIPAWLDQDVVPDAASLSADTRSLWRSTWTPNRPLVLWSGGTPARYVMGLTARPTPLVGGALTVKEAAKAMHVDDYAHLWYDKAAEGKEPDIKAAFAPVRLLSTEGANNWYSKNLDMYLRLWGHDRLLGKASGVHLGFHNERGDTYGTRSISEWVEIDLDRLTLEGDERDTFYALLAFAAEVRQKMSAPMLRASDLKIDGKMRSALVEAAQRDFCASIDPIILGAMALATTSPVDVVSGCEQIAKRAQSVFRQHTSTISTPATFYRVEEARSRFASTMRALLLKAIEPHRNTVATTHEEINA